MQEKQTAVRVEKTVELVLAAEDAFARRQILAALKAIDPKAWELTVKRLDELRKLEGHME